jgi:adenosylhomocysteine nucleosidase
VSGAIPRIGIIAAMQREVAPLVKGWKQDASLRAKKIYVWENERAVVACAGMGERRVAMAVETACARGEVTELVSVGWAGAVHGGLRAGSVHRPRMVIDTKTGQRFACVGGSGVLVTTDAVADIVEKQRLHAAYNADLVDMEAATVARLAEARGLKFRAVKAVSDEFDFEMKELALFSTPDGQFREGAFGLHVALRPWLWSGVMAMAGSSKRSAEALCAALRDEL